MSTEPNGIHQARARIGEVLRGAFSRGRAGSFRIRCEVYKRDIYRVFVIGSVSWCFYVTADAIADRSRKQRDAKRNSVGGLDATVRRIESTLLEALATTGFGEFTVKYASHSTGRYRITIDGTERVSVVLSAEDVTASEEKP